MSLSIDMVPLKQGGEDRILKLVSCCSLEEADNQRCQTFTLKVVKAKATLLNSTEEEYFTRLHQCERTLNAFLKMFVQIQNL